ncbi:MAG: hypothetical protein ACE5IP_08555 [Terriglobia bacterium]
MSAEKKTPATAFLLALVCSLVTGAAQLLIKWGVDLSRSQGWTEPAVLLPLLLAYVMLAAGLLVLLLALRTGALSVIYPLIAARYIWVVAVTPLLFTTESWNLYKIAGAGVVALGVIIIAARETR